MKKKKTQMAFAWNANQSNLTRNFDEQFDKNKRKTPGENNGESLPDAVGGPTTRNKIEKIKKKTTTTTSTTSSSTFHCPSVFLCDLSVVHRCLFFSFFLSFSFFFVDFSRTPSRRSCLLVHLSDLRPSFFFFKVCL